MEHVETHRPEPGARPVPAVPAGPRAHVEVAPGPEPGRRDQSRGAGEPAADPSRLEELGEVGRERRVRPLGERRCRRRGRARSRLAPAHAEDDLGADEPAGAVRLDQALHPPGGVGGRDRAAGGGPVGLVAELQHLLVVRGRDGRVRGDRDRRQARVEEQPRQPPPHPAALHPVRVVREDPASEIEIGRLHEQAVVVGIAHHHAPARSRHPHHLGQGLRGIDQMVEHAVGPARVERLVLEGNRVGVADTEVHGPRQAEGPGARLADLVLALVDAGGRHVRRPARDGPDVLAGAAADVEDVVPFGEGEQLEAPRLVAEPGGLCGPHGVRQKAVGSLCSPHTSRRAPAISPSVA